MLRRRGLYKWHLFLPGRQAAGLRRRLQGVLRRRSVWWRHTEVLQRNVQGVLCRRRLRQRNVLRQQLLSIQRNLRYAAGSRSLLRA